MKGTKLIALFLVIVLTMSLFTACSSEESNDVSQPAEKTEATQEATETEETKSGKITDEPVTLTMWTQFDDTNVANIADTLVYQQLEEITGVTVEFIHPPVGEEQQAFNLLLASGDLPDMMGNIPVNFPGGPDKAIADGYFLRLNEYIDEYAPNYAALRNSNEEIARQTITDEGNIWSFSCIQLDQEPPWSGMFIREDWLKDLSMEVPKTIDQWEEMLIAFKEQKGAEGPLLLQFNWKYNSNAAFASAFGASVATTQNTNLEFMNQDGKVVYGQMLDGYKDYLELMARWYDMGLIDPDFATRDNKSFDAYFTSGKAGAVSHGYGCVSSYVAAGKEADEDFSMVAAPMPVVNEGDEIHVRQSNPYVREYYRAISADTKYPEIAVQWMDYAYSDEGFLLYNYGVEGDTYTLEDKEATFGKSFLPETYQSVTPTFTDKLLNSPNGDFWSIYKQYKVHVTGFLRNPLSYDMAPAVLDAMEIWTAAGDDWVMPPIIMTDEEAREFSAIMSEARTYAEEMTFKMIMGLESVDNFDEFVATLKELGIERAIEIKQNALDRYLAR